MVDELHCPSLRLLLRLSSDGSGLYVQAVIADIHQQKILFLIRSIIKRFLYCCVNDQTDGTHLTP